ncbi:DUF4258 domain-containing protein [Starkeya koreensis]|uniref:DUF4258 domain-containing protein n=1 Tax=Ancylobacter koreensis TaxID=266121 RepID=A0ABT0DNY4_9HYPH|nr:DUF4258 domain-containing protein [Ancylobacter koreensis]
MRDIRLSAHVRVVMAERGIEAAWVARTLEAPDRVDVDPNDPALERAFAAIAERDGRVLRVVYRPDGDAVFVVTTFFDRGARR